MSIRDFFQKTLKKILQTLNLWIAYVIYMLFIPGCYS